MASYKPVIPRADREFNLMQETLIKGVVAHHLAWGIPPDEIAILQSEQANWNAIWAIAWNKSSRTHLHVTAKNHAREIYETKLRPFIQRWIVYNSQMTDSNRQAVGIYPRIRKGMLIPKPDTLPLMSTKPDTAHRAHVYFRQQPNEEGSLRRGKPKGVKFCEIVSEL